LYQSFFFFFFFFFFFSTFFSDCLLSLSPFLTDLAAIIGGSLEVQHAVEILQVPVLYASEHISLAISGFLPGILYYY
jgi:hypothetical protein